MCKTKLQAVVGRELQQRPKDDDPPQTRQGFDYFVYPEQASLSSTGSETSVSCSDDSGINIASATFEPATAFTDVEAPAASNSGNGVGDEGAAASSVQAPATAPSFGQEHGSEKCGAGEDDGVAPPTLAPPPPPPSETKDDDESWAETEEEDQQRVTTTAKATGSFSWTPSATSTECMVCLESYTAGDRVCRIPCGHAFHVEVRQTPG